MVKSPRPWTNAPSIYKHMQTRLHYFFVCCSSLHKNKQWWFPPEFSALPFWLISHFSSQNSCPFCWVQPGTFAQFLCSHIFVTAFPWQVKQFTNTREQICCKRRTRIFWLSNGEKKNQCQNIDYFTGSLTLNELYLLIIERTRRLKGLKMAWHKKTNYVMFFISAWMLS